MVGRGWLVTIGVTTGALAGATVAGADPAEPASAIVHVEDYMPIAAQTWDVVRHHVEDIFRAAGVDISWAGPLRVPMREVSQKGPRRLAIVLVNIQTPFAGSRHDTEDVLGRAAPQYARAWVFVNRVAEAANNGPVDANLLLARVIAHEMGHLLLPGEAHAGIGIMRPGIDLNQVGFFRFTNEQAQQLRAGIVGR